MAVAAHPAAAPERGLERLQEELVAQLSDVIGARAAGRRRGALALLDAYDRRHRPQLGATLRSVRLFTGRIGPTSAHLGVHVNTVRYRLLAVERVLCACLDDPLTRALLTLEVIATG